MSKQDAHRLLDMARLGFDVPEAQILQALVVTGDLDRWHISHLDPFTREAT
jgi:hypothetical protein